MRQIRRTPLLLALLLAGSCHQGGTTNGNQVQNKDAEEIFRKEHNGYSESELKEVAASKVPITMVRNVEQDKSGNILAAAAWGGVFRYDGRSFTNLTQDKIGFRRFWDVLEDRKGNLWFATTDSGVYSYQGSTLQHFSTRNGLVDNRVMTIYEDSSGIIWFGTGGGVSRYDGRSFQNFTTEDGLSHNDLTTIMQDKTGKMWFGTRGAACFYDGKTFAVLKDRDGKVFNNVWAIMEDRKGIIWFGNANGLWRYDGSTFTNVSPRGAYAMIQDQKGNIWTTGEVNQGVWALSRYDAQSLYNKVPSVTQIRSGGRMDFLGILEASDGSIWFGSGNGVHRYDGKTFTDFKSKPENK